MKARPTSPECKAPDRFAEILLDWYDRYGRKLPWRETRDPYRIWISEIILQQTRVAQGWDYFLRFVERFPDIRSLAEAPEDEVMRLWQGLGYYSRARNLHAAARELVSRHGGVFPQDYTAVRALQGIGDYTAAAICSFAFRMPCAVVDGNVYRVLSRLLGIRTPIDSGAGRKCFAGWAQRLISPDRPDDYNQAIMDFGATWCTPRQPRCDSLTETCPFREQCAAARLGTPEAFPVKSGPAAVRPRYFHYLHVRCNGLTVLRKRTARDIWQHLYEYPLVEADGPLDGEALLAHPTVAAWTEAGEGCRIVRTVRMPVHQLSHRSIHAVFFETEWKKLPPAWNSTGGEWICIPESEETGYPVSRLTERYRQQAGVRK